MAQWIVVLIRVLPVLSSTHSEIPFSISKKCRPSLQENLSDKSGLAKRD